MDRKTWDRRELTQSTGKSGTLDPSNIITPYRIHSIKPYTALAFAVVPILQQCECFKLILLD